jgi:NAD+ diphosphatase
MRGVTQGFTFCPRCARPLEPRSLAGVARLVCPDDGCGFTFYDNPLPVVAALVEHEGKVLLARAQGWPEHMFGLVTGFLERGETPEQGTLRELREELGLGGEIVRLIGVYPFLQRNELIVAYHVRAEGQVSLGEEISAIKAVDPDRLRGWPFGTGLAVQAWVDDRRKAAP